VAVVEVARAAAVVLAVGVLGVVAAVTVSAAAEPWEGGAWVVTGVAAAAVHSGAVARAATRAVGG
jgi:hypothetical protein